MEFYDIKPAALDELLYEISESLLYLWIALGPAFHGHADTHTKNLFYFKTK